MGIPFLDPKKLASGLIEGFKKDLEKDGVHIDEIAKKAADLEKQLEPLLINFAVDAEMVNKMFFGSKLSTAQLGMAEHLFQEALGLEHDFAIIAGKLAALGG